MASEFDLPIVGVPKRNVGAPLSATPAAIEQTTQLIAPEEKVKSDFDLPIANKKPLDTQVQRIKKEEEIPFESLYKDPNNLKIIRE